MSYKKPEGWSDLEWARYRVMNFRDRYIEWAEVKSDDANVKAINALLDATSPKEPEEKKTRKLWEILNENAGKGSKGEAKVAIDAVIECYKDWQVDFSCDKAVLTFPEYLKEKML